MVAVPYLAVFRAAVAAWQALLCLPVQEAIVAVPARVSVQARAAVVNFSLAPVVLALAREEATIAGLQICNRRRNGGYTQLHRTGAKWKLVHSNPGGGAE